MAFCFALKSGNRLPAKPARQVAAVVEDEATPPPSEPIVDWRDLVGIVGLATLCLGVGFIYWPASLIVLGAALLLIAWRS